MVSTSNAAAPTPQVRLASNLGSFFRGFVSMWSLVFNAIIKFFEAVPSRLRAFPGWFKGFWKGLWWGDFFEEPKVLIHKKSFWRVMRKIAIHLPSVLVAIVILGLNFGTFFIGNQLQGNSSGSWQDFYKLALQVCAKLHELLIVASLSTIMMDVIRHHLLTSPGGLPLGLLTAKVQFVDVMFLLSPDFRHGMLGFPGLRKYLFTMFIVVCSTLVLFAGPSSALLLIPKEYAQWDAGGATFYVVGTNESLWPSTLTADSVGGSNCLSPSVDQLAIQELNTTGCPWAGFEGIRQFWESSHLNQDLTNMLLADGVSSRDIILKYYALTGAAVGVPIAPTRYAKLLSDIWRNAMINGPMAQLGSLTRLQNLRYRDREGTTIKINSEVPIVETTCLTNETVNFAGIVNETYYPVQLEYPSNYYGTPKPGFPYLDSSMVIGRQLSFDSPMYANSSRVAALWLETPADEPIGSSLDGNTVIGRSSAYLNVQIPYPNGTVGFHVSCSIDARWLKSTIEGTNVAHVASDAVYSTPPVGLYDPSIYPAVDDGNWRTVRLSADWLNVLTPAITEGNTSIPGWNTLASLITDMGLDNDTSLIGDWGSVGVVLGGAVSSLVADGMSRIGYDRNGGDTSTRFSPDVWSEHPGKDLDDMLTHKYHLPSVYDPYGTSDDWFEMKWDIAVKGYGYMADGVPYYLAAAVLLVHLALVLVHTAWVIRTGHTSTAWSSITELVTLAFKSFPPETGLEHASIGIGRFRSLQDPIRVRQREYPAAAQTTAAGSQSSGTVKSDGVEMVYGADFAPSTDELVEVEKKY